LLEIKRVMKKTGQCLIVVPFPERRQHGEIHVGKWYLKTDTRSTVHDKNGVRFNQVLERAGFKIIKKATPAGEEFNEAWRLLGL